MYISAEHLQYSFPTTKLRTYSDLVQREANMAAVADILI